MKEVGGHYVSAAYFLMLGVWWSYSVWSRYYRCRAQGKPFYATFSFDVTCGRFRFPFEALFLLAAAASGFLIELPVAMRTWINPHTRQPYRQLSPDNLMHFAMYLMFFVLGIVELAVHCLRWLPRELELIAGVLAFSGEGLLFFVHSHHPDPILVRLHMLLTVLIFGATLSTIFELFRSEGQIYASLMRGYFTLLQGTWLVVNGYYMDDLHSPHRDKANPEAIDRLSMLLIVYFLFHLIGVLLVLFLLAWFSHLTLFCCFSRSTRSEKEGFLEDDE